MKKTRFPALILVLALLCSVLVCGAAALSVDCTVDGVQNPLSVEAGKVVLPEAPAYADGRIFLGWYAQEQNGQKVFLPAGADYAPQGSVSFEAIAVRMETAGKGSARVAGQEVGVRFTSEIRRADYEKLALRLGRENFSFGTYIVAAEYLAGTKNVFTPEALAAAGYDRYIDVPTTGYYEKTNSAYVWAGSVTAIRPGNYTREYAGIGYISLTYTDGTSARILCPFSAKKHVQMASETVLMSYEDRSIYYDYLILDENGTSHSCYTAEQLAVLKNYLDDCVSIRFRSKNSEEKKQDATACFVYYLQGGKYYQSPWVLSSSFDRLTDVATLTVTPPPGRTLESLKGVAFGGSYKKPASMTWQQDGTLSFQFKEYSPAY